MGGSLASIAPFPELGRSEGSGDGRYMPSRDPVLSGPSSVPASPGATILLVDDEESVRCVTRRMLEARGYGVVTAGDGFEGMRTYCADPERYDLVLLDVTMPELDGKRTLTRLREVDPDVRVVLMSGIPDDYQSSSYDANGADFLQKPYGIEDLHSVVNAALDR